ncbi:MAG: hypothetical protein J7497_17230, partial [Chitinophagaceae bacterium]|nr:hypothetical protein [Chitinophagaceae bacterium]
YGYVIPTPGDTTGFGALIDAPKLTADIINKGDIKVYINLGTEADPVIVSLPYIDTDGILISAVFFEGGIQLTSNVNAGTALNDNNEKVLQYRYVLIPGGVLGVKPDNVHLDNYKEVQSYLKLKD